MKVFKEIKGINKLRDMAICLDYIAGIEYEDIKAKRKLSLTVRRIQQIVYDNAAFINPRVAWPKSKRVRILQKWIEDTPKSKKDPADLLEQVRKEVEGDKATTAIVAVPMSEEQHKEYLAAAKRLLGVDK